MLSAVDAVDQLLERFREVENRSLIGPIDGELDSLALKSRALKESMAAHQEILSHDPTDPAAQQALEAHQRELDAILARYEALVERRRQLVASQQAPVRQGIELADDDESGSGSSGGSGGRGGIDRPRQVIEALQHEEAQLGRTALQQRIHNELRAAGIDLASAQGQRIARLVEIIHTEEQAIDRAAEAQAAFNDVAQFAGHTAINAFDRMASGAGSLKDVFADLTRQLSRMALEAALLGQGPLASLFGMAGAAGSTSGLLGALFGGALAHGGPASPGRAYMVGERGPELFVPKSAGVVIPNGKLNGGGGTTQNVVINAPVTVNATGGEPAQNRDLAQQVSRAVEGQVRGLVARELRVQMRPGNMLNR